MTKLTRNNIDVNQKPSKLSHKVNHFLLDSTTDEYIAKHIAQDDAEALLDALEFAKSNKIKLTRKAVNWHNMPTPLNKETSMPTRNVVLTEHQALMIENLVASGRYQNASEVLREGLRMIEQREKEDALRLQALREAMQLGMADFEAGRYKQFDSKESLRAHLKSIVAKAAAAV
jgi:antitoxin ParD1/3/4